MLYVCVVVGQIVSDCHVGADLQSYVVTCVGGLGPEHRGSGWLLFSRRLDSPATLAYTSGCNINPIFSNVY